MRSSKLESARPYAPAVLGLLEWPAAQSHPKTAPVFLFASVRLSALLGAWDF
jgi:hypothetical protein